MMTDDKQRLFDELRHRYPTMVYRRYSWHEDEEGLHVEFEFAMGEHTFRPHACVERRHFLHFDLGSRRLDRLVFNIGMAELVSYWKCACPPHIEVACGSLDSAQTAFWRKLYWHGLGEFFYTNGLLTDEESFVQIVSGDPEGGGLEPLPGREGSGEGAEAYLVPIGGGKDSVVTLTLLQAAGRPVRPLIMNPRGATIECARVAGFDIDQVLVIRRHLDPLLLQLNSQGFLNGHTPFSAMLAFYTLLASACSGIANIALSNELSANEATVANAPGSGRYAGVNHQYSKSLQFEDDFRAYVRASFPEPYNYFSFLRPLTELQIAMLFSRCTAYHDVFRSCNVGSKTDSWCCHCAKCLFAYIILSPFLPPARLAAIFGAPLLDDLTLRPEFDQLTGLAPTKPFECVGTVSEVHTALAMAIARWYPDSRPALLEGFAPASNPPALNHLSPLGNLTPQERNIIASCIANNN